MAASNCVFKIQTDNLETIIGLMKKSGTKAYQAGALKEDNSADADGALVLGKSRLTSAQKAPSLVRDVKKPHRQGLLEDREAPTFSLVDTR